MKTRTITVNQYINETKLMSLVPPERRVVYELKRIVPVQEWKSVQKVVLEILGLTESDTVTDDQIAALIQKAAKELKVPDAPDSPSDIEVDVDAMEKGKEDAIELKNESKQSLHESLVLSAILAAPTILKLIANIIDWVYKAFTIRGEERKKYDEEKAAFAYAKKTGKLPDGTPVDDHKLHDMENNLYKSKAGQAILKLAHKLHSLYISPIRAIIAGLKWMYSQGKNISMLEAWKQAKKPAEIIFAVVMIGIAGFGAWHAISAIPSAAAVVSSAAAFSNLATAVIDATKGGDMTVTALKAALGHVHL
jgi:hypothetical protein